MTPTANTSSSLNTNRGITLGANGGFLEMLGIGPFTYNGVIPDHLGAACDSRTLIRWGQ